MLENNASKLVKRYYHVWCEMNKIYADWAKKHDISYNAMLVLYSLWEGKIYCTQKMICNQWMLPKQTVNSILKDFEKKGLVCFDPSFYDQRTRGIRLTDAGIEYAKPIIPSLQKLEAEVMEKLGEAKANAIIENTSLYIEYFKEGMDNE